jgi:prevent-host-death family protein
MSTVGAYEAKTHLPRLLDEVEAGRTITITKHGRPVARLIGIRGVVQGTDPVADFAEARRGLTLGMPVREAIDEGRK